MDPQSAPVIGIDDHLPALPPECLHEAALRRRFAQPPPWQPEIRHEPPFTDRAPRAAAVLMAVVLRDRPTLLLTQRTAHLSTHAGQIAFPGGQVDRSDPDPEATALREAWEEVGLAPAAVEVLGRLPEYHTGSAFVVTPVVGLVRQPPVLRPDPHEVADAFEVPLAYLMNPAHHRRHVWQGEGRLRHWFSMPYHDGQQERYIWGATAGMLRNLYRLLSA
jgi:8-oxo-dGTP pyrophosphatase MutT (NUDIX family)